MKRKRSDLKVARPFKKPRQVAKPALVRSLPLKASVEKKVADVAAAVYQVNTTGTITLLAAPVPGTDMNNRVGRKVTVDSVYIRGMIGTEAGAAGLNTAIQSPTQLVRMMVFVDWQPNGAVPVVTDILNTAHPASHINLNNRDRFKILADEQFALGPYVIVTAVNPLALATQQCVELKRFIKCKIETVFNAGTAGTIADINSGAIYMMWIGNQAAGANLDANALLGTRVRYFDS